MAMPSGKSDFFNMNVKEMHAQAEHALHQLVSAYQPAPESDHIGPDTLGKSLEHFFSILDSIEQQTPSRDAVDQGEMQSLADHGLGLMNELND